MTSSALPNSATQLAREIVQTCLNHGIKHVVIAPGSRNAPLSWAFAQAEKAGLVTLHVRIDERDAGFLALGISKATNTPVPVVVTSGSAVANLLPAVVEGFHSGIPIVILSADRPATSRGHSAPQTINQVGIFGSFVKTCIDISASELGSGKVAMALAESLTQRSAPVQINVQFELPLMPEVDHISWQPQVQLVPEISRPQNPGSQIAASAHGLFIIGDNSDVAAVQEIDVLSRQLGWPVICEPSANAHSLNNSIAHGVALLQAEVAPMPDIVVTLGAVGLSRAVLRLLTTTQTHLAIHSQSAGSDIPDPVSSAAQVLETVPQLTNTPDSSWLLQWQEFNAKAESVITKALHPDTLTGPSAAQTLWNFAGANDQLFVAASWPVRHLEAYAANRDGLTVFGNRGANGIDGLISTAAGVAIGGAKRTYLLLGDIAFLHDLGGLNLGSDQVEPDLTIVVMDNNGSGIFSQLEQGADEYQEYYEKVFGTPHGKDLWVIAESLGVPAKQVTTKSELAFALTNFEKVSGLKVIVCLTGDRKDENDLIKQIVSQIRNS